MPKKNSSKTTIVKSPHAAAAQAIRQDLKKAFPGEKFRVRSDSFSMGNSVDVSWTDGPTRDAVDSIIKRYQSGYFDLEQDMHVYNRDSSGLPQVKYVSGHRSMSDNVRAELLAYVAEKFFEPAERHAVTLNTPSPGGFGYVSEMVWREFSERSYSAGLLVTLAESTGETVEEEGLDDLTSAGPVMQLADMACATGVRQ